jgi:ElaB/YqjD/DUF883 family membrane-anchored ribosome-binding protein
MTPKDNSSTDLPSESVKSVSGRIADAASQMKDKVSDFGRAATEKIDQGRSSAASGLESTASALHDGGEKVTGLAHATADKLSSTADYLRNNDVKRMMADVEELVKKNPGPSLFAAGVIGFLAGRALRNSD